MSGQLTLRQIRETLIGLVGQLEPDDALTPQERVQRLSTLPHTYRKVDFAAGRRKDEKGQYVEDDGGSNAVPLAQANLITSEVTTPDGVNTGLHSVVVDIDLPCHVESSTTPGHYHLFIDKPMTWGEYSMLLRVLQVVGIVEEGYVAASLRRGASMVRLPWIRKAVVA